MFAFELRWAERIFDAVFPAGVEGGLAKGARDFPLRGLLVDVSRCAPRDFVFGLRAGIWLVTLAGPLLVGRLRRFGALSIDERAAVLQAMTESRFYLVREIPMLLKMVAGLGYAAFPEVQRAAGLETVDATPPAWAEEARR